jgi:WD domain, G-beta repeat
VADADEKVARVWDMKSGEPKLTFEHAAQLNALATSPDGRTVLTTSEDGTARLWNTETGTGQFTLRHGCGVRDAWFIAGGSLAVTWSRGDAFQSQCDPKAMVWDVATGEERATVRLDADTVGFSPDGKLMFSVQGRGYSPEMQRLRAQALVRVWDLDTGEERFAEPFESDKPIRTATFSPDGRLLVTASGNSALMWAIGGDLLQSAIAAATSVCLKPEFRRQNLGESDSDARRKYEACEHKHGRE